MKPISIKEMIPEFPRVSAWSDNIPFAFWLVETIKPKTFVELGVHTGVSYFAICQAAKTLNLETKCFAVDTWKGDQHTGFYGEWIYKDFIQYEKKYSDFSTVIRSTFDDALGQFEDNSIDLLHIDGEHTYMTVRHDFESWFPKLRKDAIVLFHDVVCDSFEVWKYWGELLGQYPSFTLSHGSGLGVLSLDGRLAEPSSLEDFAILGRKLMNGSDTESEDQLLSRARELTKEGKWTEAYPFYRKIYIGIKSRSDDKKNKIYGETCAYFARVSAASERYGTAYDWYRHALEADPSATIYRLEMINRAMKPLRWMTGARAEAIYATETAPDDPVAWCVLGQIEGELDNIPACLDAYSKFVDKSNGSTFSLLTKATFLIKQEQYEEAETLCDVVISRNESLGDILCCKAMIMANYGDHEKAIDLFEEALKQGSNDDSMILYFLSLSLFSIGRHKEGWQAMWRARITNTSFAPLYGSIKRFTKPLKQLFVMQPPPAVVHIHAEAGEGDNILFMRYLPLLVERGYTVRYEARNSTVKLVQDSFPNVEATPLAKDFPGISGLPDFDYHLPITDLPFIFQTDIDTIPWNGPYIKADPELVEKYRPYKGKIGIFWSTGTVNWAAGSINQNYARNKSVRFDLLKPIIDLDPSLFVSLQVGVTLSPTDRIVTPLIGNDFTWSETAALVENLDLVITIDTGVAHLAGAMGKPVWVMMHKYLTSFQMLAEYKDAPWNTNNPWYPSMRVFRQKKRGDWDSVVLKVATELKHRLDANATC